MFRWIVVSSLTAHVHADLYDDGASTGCRGCGDGQWCDVSQSHFFLSSLGDAALSNHAIQVVGGELGSQQPIGPNDHVTLGQSSNDTFPTAMHIAAVTELDDRLIPKVQALQSEIDAKATQWACMPTRPALR
ncbi:MAG: fumarate hydratase, class [Mycobacterium sp.]|nr:fumarate hydratase, class [Mycobacterium sp.]